MRKKRIISLAIAVSFLFGIVAFYSRCQTDVFYCKQLALILSFTKLNQFRFSYITQSEAKNEIYIDFVLKSSYLYEEDDIDDIITVRNIVTEYLEKHPDSKLSRKKIAITFYEGPGADLFCVRNFDDSQPSKSLSGLNYYRLSSMQNLSLISLLPNAECISVSTENIDNIDFFRETDSLRYLEIHSDKLTDDIKADIIALFADCEVITDEEHYLELKATPHNNISQTSQ